MLYELWMTIINENYEQQLLLQTCTRFNEFLITIAHFFTLQKVQIIKFSDKL